MISGVSAKVTALCFVFVGRALRGFRGVDARTGAQLLAAVVVHEVDVAQLLAAVVVHEVDVVGVRVGVVGAAVEVVVGAVVGVLVSLGSCVARELT